MRYGNSDRQHHGCCGGADVRYARVEPLADGRHRRVQQIQDATNHGAFASSANRVGLSAAASLAGGGSDVFYLTNLNTLPPLPGSTPALPEPGTSALVGAALGATAMLRRRGK